MKILFQINLLTLTDTFISCHQLQDQVIILYDCSGVRIDRKRIGDYNNEGVIFAFLGMLFVFVMVPIGTILLALAIASFAKKIYRYDVTVNWRGYDKRIFSTMSKNHAKQAEKAIKKAISSLNIKTPERAYS